MKTRRTTIAMLMMMSLLISTISKIPAHVIVADVPKTEQHRFTLGAGERVKFGFVAKKTGAISAVVNVNSQSPVTVSLTSPQGRQPITKQGKGEIKLDVPARSFADDSLWFVSINEPTDSKNNFGKQVASGTVSISYVPADKTVVDRLTAAKRAEIKQKLNALKARTSRQATSSQVLVARRAALEKEMNQRHSAQKERALRKVHLVGNGQTAGSQPSQQSNRHSTQQTTFKGRVNPNDERTAANTRIQPPKGSNSTPQISSLDVIEGDPGTPVVITGTNFGSVQGEVHFIINPGMDVAAKIEPGTWSDTQVMAYVPDASGIQAFNGQVYVKMAGGGKSLLKPFHFIPAMDVQDFPVTDVTLTFGDRLGTDYTDNSEWEDIDLHTAVVFHMGLETDGYNDDDSFLSNTTLKNGWVYDSASVDASIPDGETNHDAWASLKTPESSYKGQSKATIQVRWFDTPFYNYVTYRFSVTVKGPKGTSPK